MDINDLRSLVTVLSFAAFAGIVLWAWSGKRKTAFDEAANLPFADDDTPAQAPHNLNRETRS
jgi:cytochrome c oxidase cbb3-type subunit 4